jgi:hypothetical protein
MVSRTRTALVVVGLLSVAAVVGLILLFAGLKGSANHAESVCEADVTARPGYGGWSISGELFPPSFTCEIGGSGVPTLTISHPTTALFGFVAVVVVSACYVAGVLVLIGWVVKRPTGRTDQLPG